MVPHTMRGAKFFLLTLFMFEVVPQIKGSHWEDACSSYSSWQTLELPKRKSVQDKEWRRRCMWSLEYARKGIIAPKSHVDNQIGELNCLTVKGFWEFSNRKLRVKNEFVEIINFISYEHVIINKSKREWKETPVNRGRRITY